ncbi:MAG: hypothetical protein ACLPMG_05265, partial [Terriglobales bacterium]
IGRPRHVVLDLWILPVIWPRNYASFTLHFCTLAGVWASEGFAETLRAASPAAPKGAVSLGALTVSLKRYPDTKRHTDTTTMRG